MFAAMPLEYHAKRPTVLFAIFHDAIRKIKLRESICRMFVV